MIHDKTVHDRPSYTASYGRSRNTVQSLMKKYPTAKVHYRPASGCGGGVQHRGQKTEDRRYGSSEIQSGRGPRQPELYGTLRLCKEVSQTAEGLHKGFGGPIIEKEYRFNEFVSNQAILLEVGNNKNTIDEARACAENFAEVMAKIVQGK